MGSTRLPAKVLMPIAGKPLLAHIVDRLARLRHPATVVVATSSDPRDDPVENFCRESAVACFRGDEQDVLARYYHCARHYHFRQVVRLTADNPFYDMEELDRLIELHVRERADFTHSFASLPVGVGAEIFTFDALEASFLEGHEPHHREHVDEFLLEHPERFRTLRLAVTAEKSYPAVRLTVDTIDDYRRVCCIAESASSAGVTTEEAIALCSRCA